MRAQRMILHDVVAFDLDGTLVDSARLWCEATAGAMAEVFARNGIRAPVPDERTLRQVIGTPAPDSLFALLPADLHPLVPEITEGVRSRGSAAMRAGPPPLFPRVLETLGELRRSGCAVAIATNGGRRYLDACLDSLGLRPLVDLPVSLDSPGVSNKVEMVGAILREAGTRRGVLVGDRFHDREAAHGNGIPFVAFEPGYGSEAEWDGAEGRVSNHGDLLVLLGRRAGAVRALADEVVRRADGRGRPFLVGVTGAPGTGKSLLADDLRAVLSSLGIDARLLRLDDYRRKAPPLAAPDAGDHLAHAFDLEGFEAALAETRTGSGRAALVEGLFLLDARVRPSLDFAIHLEASEAVLLRRLEATRGREEARRAREIYLPAHAAFAAARPPRRHADLRIDSSNPLALEPLG